MAVQVIPGLKRKVGADAHRQRANHRIADVEVIMQVARGNTPNDAVVRIIGGKLRHPRLEGAAHLHAGEDAVDTVLIAPLHPFEMSQDALLLAHTSLSLQYGDFVVAGVSLYPSSIFGSSLRQHLRRNWILTMQVAEKMHNVFGTGEQGHIPLDDDAIETVIYKNQETCKKLREGFHRSPLRIFWSDNQNHPSWRPVESTEHILSALRCSPGISRAQPLAIFRYGILAGMALGDESPSVSWVVSKIPISLHESLWASPR